MTTPPSVPPTSILQVLQASASPLPGVLDPIPGGRSAPHYNNNARPTAERIRRASASALDPVYSSMGGPSTSRTDPAADRMQYASLYSSTSSNGTNTSEETKVEPEANLRPAPARTPPRSRPRTPIVIPRPELREDRHGEGNVDRRSVLGGLVTDSPVEMKRSEGHSEEEMESKQALGAEWRYEGLDSRADEMLREVPQLVPERPLTMSMRMYQKPVGEYSRDSEEQDERSSLLSRPPPHRAMSGTFRSEDLIDGSMGWVGPATLSDADWDEKETPDGMPYFMHKHLPVVTDDYLRLHEHLELVDKWTKVIYGIILAQMASQTCGYAWPANWQLYLHVDKGFLYEGQSYYGDICYYYLIDTTKREVFWLHSFPNYSYVIEELAPDAPSKRIRLQLQHEFWAHMEIFSQGDPIPGAEKELRDMLLWAAFDRITSPTNSVSPFETGQAEQLLSILDQFKGPLEDSPVKNVAIARLMVTCYRARLLNRWGEHGARVDRDQPLRTPEEGNPPRIKFYAYTLMHMLVMGGDRWYLEKIKSLTVDNYVPPQAWKNMVRMLVETNNQATLIVAALLFTGNIGFLGINGLEGDQFIISIVATLLSLGSLFTGLQQVLHHYDLKETTAQTGGQYCYAAQTAWLGYRALAVYYALPNALLIWSAIATVIALLVWCFQTVEMDWASRTMTILILLTLGFVGISVIRFSRHLFSFMRGTEGPTKCWMQIAMNAVIKPLSWFGRRLGLVPRDEEVSSERQQEEGMVPQNGPLQYPLEQITVTGPTQNAVPPTSGQAPSKCPMKMVTRTLCMVTKGWRRNNEAVVDNEKQASAVSGDTTLVSPEEREKEQEKQIENLERGRMCDSPEPEDICSEKLQHQTEGITTTECDISRPPSIKKVDWFGHERTLDT